MSVEVWVDIFGFIKRIQLARTVCLTCWHLYDKMELIDLPIQSESDIAILLEILATPRPDGQQRVASLLFQEDELAQKVLATIKKVNKQKIIK
jgi:hypothetical protein